MLCDIEMPAESGLSLFRWVKKKGINVECIFLTAHADFIYAKEAIQLGGFDYILQPARYEDIEQAIVRAEEKIISKRKP
jgi:two-component system, response regulator YesN